MTVCSVIPKDTIVRRGFYRFYAAPTSGDDDEMGDETDGDPTAEAATSGAAGLAGGGVTAVLGLVNHVVCLLLAMALTT